MARADDITLRNNRASNDEATSIQDILTDKTSAESADELIVVIPLSCVCEQNLSDGAFPPMSHKEEESTYYLEGFVDQDTILTDNYM